MFRILNSKRVRLLDLVLVLLSIAFFGSLSGSTVFAQSGTTITTLGLPTNQIIIQFKRDAASARTEIGSQAQMDRLSNAAQVELSYFRAMSGDAHVLRLPGYLPLVEVEAAAARLETLPEVEYAEPDSINLPVGDPAPKSPMLTPNDPQYSSQWHYFAPVAGSYGANMPAGWDITTGSPALTVAVLDTGVIFNHPDLSGRFATVGYDMISDTTSANDGGGRDNDPSDPGDWVANGECGGSPPSNSSWHGTHTAGTVGASSNNGVGVAGINWQSPLQIVRVLGKCGGTISDIADGMRWAAGLTVPGVPDNTQSSRVVNMSLGGAGTCYTTFQNAINDVRAQNVVIVVSAGNDGTDASASQPANCDGVITVAATDRDGNKASYSNFGSVVEIAAPGGYRASSNDPNGVLSTLNDGATTPGNNIYAYYDGTSMAAPHVTGIVSLMLSLNPSLTPDQVLTYLQSNVTPFPSGSTCNTSICGTGIVNAGAALNAISGGVSVVAPSDRQVTPGTFVVYDFAITNKSGSQEVYDLTYSSSQAWADFTSLPTTLTIAANGTANVQVPVNVPSNATSGTIEDTALVVASQSNPLVNDTDSVLTTVVTSPVVGIGNYEDTNPAIVYTGKWTQVNLQAAGAGSYHKSNEVGATASLTVVGAKNFYITSSTAGNRGIANVLVDGNVVATIDGYGQTAYRAPFGPYPLPDTGQHTITLQVAGTKNPQSANTTVTLDNFIVRGGKKKFDDKDPEVSYAGKWKLVNHLSAAGRTFHKSTEANATASVVITGAKSFAITTIKAKNRGIANVLIDGNVVGQIDAYDTTTQYRFKSQFYALPDTGQHTITLQVTGTKNANSKGVTVTLDNFLIKYP